VRDVACPCGTDGTLMPFFPDMMPFFNKEKNNVKIGESWIVDGSQATKLHRLSIRSLFGSRNGNCGSSIKKNPGKKFWATIQHTSHST
jgi:hypothetical protein